MAVVANPSKAVAAFLTSALEGKTTGTIKEGLRIFQPRLPKGEEGFMPARCAVVSRAGGSQMFSRTFLPVTDTILDVTCFGSTREDANNLADEAMFALQEMRLSKWAGVVLKYVRIAAAPVTGMDTHSNWPEALLVVQVTHSREGGFY